MIVSGTAFVESETRFVSEQELTIISDVAKKAFPQTSVLVVCPYYMQIRHTFLKNVKDGVSVQFFYETDQLRDKFDLLVFWGEFQNSCNSNKFSRIEEVIEIYGKGSASFLSDFQVDLKDSYSIFYAPFLFVNGGCVVEDVTILAGARAIIEGKCGG